MRRAFGNLTAYQAGRSVTYAIMGGLAGWAGLVLQKLVSDITRIAGLVVAAVLIGAGVLSLIRPGARVAALSSSNPGRLLGALVARLRGEIPTQRTIRLDEIAGWAVVLEALDGYPRARLSVARALRESA